MGSNMNIRKAFLKIFPYLSSILAGVIFYLFGIQSKDFRDLFVNISAAFKVFKKWDVIENNLHEILKNPYVLNRLEDEQVIAIIQLLKSIRYLEQIQKIKDLYVETEKKASSFKIVRGKDINEENVKFLDRYLLLKDLGDNKFLVADFGDFPRYNMDKLLKSITKYLMGKTMIYSKKFSGLGHSTVFRTLPFGSYNSG